MLFSSLTFLLFFLPICLVIYFIFPSIKVKNIVLLIFSLIFYAWGEPIYIFLMLAVIFITYIFGILINKSNHSLRKFYFILAIILLIVNLLFFKYSNFLIANINTLFKIHIKSLDLALPIGISFYTFQALSYLIDLFNKKIKVQNNFLYLALYISLFPQLIAGPIVRYETIEKEIYYRKSTLNNFVVGVKRFILGLSKKVILSNSMALIADTIFNNYSQYGTLILFIGAVAYTLQIYYDFSGYSDMAIGLGKIFGFTFLENFNFPYIANSITSFWRRWHISLSSWFKDYVYIPLGGSRTTKLKHIRNILIVWLLTGFWHGASWNYIIWGLYFGILLLIEKFIVKDKIEAIPNFLRHIITMILIIISWTIFRIEDLSCLFAVLKRLFIFKSDNLLKFFSNNGFLLFNFYFIVPAIILCVPFKKIKFNNFMIKNIVNLLYIVLLIIDILFIIGSDYNPFIYFRF